MSFALGRYMSFTHTTHSGHTSETHLAHVVDGAHVDPVEGALPDLAGKEAKAVIRSLRREVAELRQQVQMMNSFKSMAYRDFLTGVHNRRSFEERLREECARASRKADYTFALVLADVDDLKLVNDTLGHAAGDDVLTAVARFLVESVREVDHVFRLGGDEFAILLPDTAEAGARIVVNRIRASFEAKQATLPYPNGLSLGMAAHPPSPTVPDAIFSRADTEMYIDKRERKSARRGAGKTLSAG
jgi:diguanylate cyclase (GGDEF)-like protein